MYRTRLHFYTPIMKASEREIKESIPVTIARKTMRYLGMNLTKEVQDLYAENYRKLMKEIEDRKKWKNIPYSWIWKNKYC